MVAPSAADFGAFVFAIGTLGGCGSSVIERAGATGGTSATGGAGATGGVGSGGMAGGAGDGGSSVDCDELDWVLSGTKDETSPTVAATADGGMVVAGSFAGDMELMGSTFSAPTRGAFTVKFSEHGEPTWARVFGEDGAARPDDLAVAPNGDVWIAGVHDGPVDFGFGAVANTNLFLLRLASDGALLSAQTFGPTDVGDLASVQTRGSAVAVAPTGEVYFSAHFDQPIDIGGSQLFSDDPGFCGSVFVARVDPSGGFLWANVYPGLGGSLDASEVGFLLAGKGSCAAVEDSSVIVGGPQGQVLSNPSMGGTTAAAAFGPAGSFATVSRSGSSSLCRMHDATGETVWERSINNGPGSVGVVVASDVAVSASGSVAVTGGFKGALYVEEEFVAESEDVDVFVAHFDSQGTSTYVEKFGGAAFDEGGSIAFDANENLLISARSESDLELSSGPHMHQGSDVVVLRRCP